MAGCASQAGSAPSSGGTSRAGSLWGSWVVANALGELIGLGLTGAIAAAAVPVLPTLACAGAVIGLLLAVACGALVEGVSVGAAQWHVLRGAVVGIPRRSWIGATAAGAAVAWALGMLPSTLMDQGADASAGAQEPSAAGLLLFTILMGIVAGSILAAPQWAVLRRHLPQAGWWIPFNAAAWAVGMPIAFRAVPAVMDSQGSLPGLLTASAYLLATGAAVGAVHGLGLVWLVRRQNVGVPAGTH
jgi:hypothetical protein